MPADASQNEPGDHRLAEAMQPEPSTQVSGESVHTPTGSTSVAADTIWQVDDGPELPNDFALSPVTPTVVTTESPAPTPVVNVETGACQLQNPLALAGTTTGVFPPTSSSATPRSPRAPPPPPPAPKPPPKKPMRIKDHLDELVQQGDEDADPSNGEPEDESIGAVLTQIFPRYAPPAATARVDTSMSSQITSSQRKQPAMATSTTAIGDVAAREPDPDTADITVPSNHEYSIPSVPPLQLLDKKKRNRNARGSQTSPSELPVPPLRKALGDNPRSIPLGGETPSASSSADGGAPRPSLVPKLSVYVSATHLRSHTERRPCRTVSSMPSTKKDKTKKGKTK